MSKQSADFRYVYFAEAEGLNRVKVGVATHVPSRVATLQTGSPVALKVLGVVETDDASYLEAAIHRQFAEDRLHGEWFTLSPALRDYMDAIARPLGEPWFRFIRYPWLREDEASVTIRRLPTDTDEDFSHRAMTVLHALNPERFAHPDA